MPLDYAALMDLSRLDAEKDAACMWDPERHKKQYEATVERLTLLYYWQRVTPPERYYR